MAVLALWSAENALAESAPLEHANAESAETTIARLESMYAARAHVDPKTKPNGSLFDLLGGEARIRVIVREMVRIHHQNPSLSGIVRKYNAEYLADVLARYLITVTGGPTRYEGPPLRETHAHLHLSDAQFLAGGADFAQAMRNVGAAEADIADTTCLLGTLRSQIVGPQAVVAP